MTDADPGCATFRDALVLAAVLTNDWSGSPAPMWRRGGTGRASSRFGEGDWLGSAYGPIGSASSACKGGADHAQGDPPGSARSAPNAGWWGRGVDG